MLRRNKLPEKPPSILSEKSAAEFPHNVVKRLDLIIMLSGASDNTEVKRLRKRLGEELPKMQATLESNTSAGVFAVVNEVLEQARNENILVNLIKAILDTDLQEVLHGYGKELEQIYDDAIRIWPKYFIDLARDGYLRNQEYQNVNSMWLLILNTSDPVLSRVLTNQMIGRMVPEKNDNKKLGR